MTEKTACKSDGKIEAFCAFRGPVPCCQNLRGLWGHMWTDLDISKFTKIIGMKITSVQYFISILFSFM